MDVRRLKKLHELVMVDDNYGFIAIIRIQELINKRMAKAFIKHYQKKHREN